MTWRFHQYKLFREIFIFRGKMSKKDFVKFLKPIWTGLFANLQRLGEGGGKTN